MLKSDEAKGVVACMAMACVTICFVVVQVAGCEIEVAEYRHTKNVEPDKAPWPPMDESPK